MRVPISFHVALARLLPAAAAAAVCACGSAVLERGPHLVQPGAPGEASRLISAAAAADVPADRHTAADVRFMQAMIPHHAQALEMAALARMRAARDEVRLIARRIALSQGDEIVMMRRWLEQRGEAVTDPHAHHGHGAAMPGMLTEAEMQRLHETTGPAFDRLFLELMIKHHEGAVTMVRHLFAEDGAGQESEIFAFASDVESDQRMEIDRMRALLGGQ